MNEEPKPYQPTSGSEQMYFTDKFCFQCAFCDPDPNGPTQCDILAKMMALDVNDPNYPEELVYDDRNGICTKHFKWDWKKFGAPESAEKKGKPVNELPTIKNPNQTNLF